MSQQHRVVNLLQQAVSLLGDTSSSPTNSTQTSQGTSNRANLSRVQQIFGSYRNFSRRPTVSQRNLRPSDEQCTWTHRFFCLADPDQETVPSRTEKRMLQECGLGEQKITFIKNENFTDFREKLVEAFPKMGTGGGFYLLRTAVTARNALELIRCPPAGYNSKYLSDRCGLGQSMVYIRPLQSSLSMSPAKCGTEKNGFCEQCLKCGEEVPIMNMPQHIECCSGSCGEIASDEPPVKRTRPSADVPICGFACVKESLPSAEDTKSNLERTKCPVCLEEFGADVLEVHAATCGDLQNVDLEETEHIGEASNLEDCLMEKMLQTDQTWDISVIRRRLVPQAMEQLSEGNESDWQKKIAITFLGEEGLDVGGLTREFFTILFENSPVFEEDLLSLDSELLETQHYYLVGRAVVMAILSGHPGPRRLQEHLVDYIIHGKVPDWSNFSTEMISRSDVLNAIKDISSLGNGSQTGEELVERYADLLELSGFNKVLSSNTKEDAVRAIKCYFLFNRILPCLIQFIEGLKLHGFLQLLQKFPTEGRSYLVKTKSDKSVDVKNFFKPVYSREQKEKEEEELVMYNFHQFLKKLERGQISSPWIDIENESYICAETVVTMNHLLKALVGCPSLPRNISSGLVIFDHNSKQLSTVNTCAPSITFSRISELQEYSTLETMMLNIIIAAYGFGLQ